MNLVNNHRSIRELSLFFDVADNERFTSSYNTSFKIFKVSTLNSKFIDKNFETYACIL